MFDCHIHPITKSDYDYYKKSSNATKVLNIRSIVNPCVQPPFEFEEFESVDEMYFLDSVNLDDLDNELRKVESNLKKYNKIVGVKVYLGYQHYYANDNKIAKVAEFARNNNLSVTFHCGETYTEFSNGGDNTYSNAKYLADILKDFPSVNFIASHLNWPDFEDLMGLIQNFDNVFTCISGTNDGRTLEEREKQNDEIKNILNQYFNKYPKLKKRLMYGTDFFIDDVAFNDVSSYEKLLNDLELTDLEREDILENNIYEAYPKLLEFKSKKV